jgi:hypothetical protein
LEEGSQNAHVLVLDSPVLSCADWSRLKSAFGKAVAEIDCTYPVDSGADGLRAAIARIRDEAEQAVRAGQSELFLTDENMGPDRMAIAMVLAAAAVHTHLVRKGLRSYASVNVRSAECLDTHYFAVLIGVGATTVNAYLAEASIADRHARGLFGDMDIDSCVARYRTAVDGRGTPPISRERRVSPEIRKRFVTPGMSLGALSPEAHETLNIAMNRIGAKAVSGEGGEDSARFKPYANGDNANSAVKQIASGASA